MDDRSQLPDARGALSALLVDHLASGQPLPRDVPVVVCGDPLDDDDLHLALYLCYELHYRGFGDHADRLEWDPGLIELRSRLEVSFLTGLREQLPAELVTAGDVAAHLRDLASGTGGRSLSAHMASDGTLEQFREFAVHRSAYQLKEADPHTWGIPRLHGRAKAAMVRIQADEYGRGSLSETHSHLFAATMRALQLDDRYGAHLGRLPGVTLATCNLISCFGMHRRRRGALVGHLALFEMTSVEPMRRYSSALARLGLPAAARRFYDVHVEADAEHGVVALDELVGCLLEEEPQLGRDVVFGARSLMLVERRFADHLLDAWAAGRSSLLCDDPHPDSAPSRRAVPALASTT
jgi:hypothetical protein